MITLVETPEDMQQLMRTTGRTITAKGLEYLKSIGTNTCATV